MMFLIRILTKYTGQGTRNAMSTLSDTQEGLCTGAKVPGTNTTEDRALRKEEAPSWACLEGWRKLRSKEERRGHSDRGKDAGTGTGCWGMVKG